MTIKRFTKRKLVLLQIVQEWWVERRGFNLPVDILSDYGFMAFSNSFPICALFFYPIKGSKMAFIGWPASSPTSTKEERSEALRELFIAVEGFAAKLGYSIVVSYPSTETMKSRFQEFGYTLGDTDCHNYIKRVR